MFYVVMPLQAEKVFITFFFCVSVVRKSNPENRQRENTAITKWIMWIWFIIDLKKAADSISDVGALNMQEHTHTHKKSTS